MSKKIGKLARRYAKAFLSAIERELGSSGSPTPAQSIATQLNGLAAIWQDNHELSGALLSPALKQQERRAALEQIARTAGLPDIAVRFVVTIFERERIGSFAEIVEAFALLADDAAGVVIVMVETASAVSAAEQREIESTIERQIHGKPVFRWGVDSELLGGIVVKYAGKVLDGSLSGRLERLERSLLT